MKLTLSLAQINLMVGDVSANAKRVIEAACFARDRQKADLVVFPELTLTGYPPEDLLLRSGLIDRVEQALSDIAQATEGICLVLGYPRRADGVLYNSAGVIRDGAVVAEYDKARLPNYSVFDEKRYFEPGERPCVVEVAGVSVGITLCEDIWFPEPAALAAAAGAELILNLNASPFHAGKVSERDEHLRERALETGLPIVYLNLIGGQDELVFDGGSSVVSASGDVVHRSAFFEESQSLVEFQAGSLLPAERVDVLPEEEAIYRALVLGVHDYVTKNGFQGVVLGLSGGIDSALTLAVAVDALGADQVEVVMMPSRFTAEISNKDAIEQAKTLGVVHRVIPIEPAFRAFLQMLDEEFAGMKPDVTEENIQARCRGIVLMAISNKYNKMLLTTGNKSEMAVGYATLYGDMAGGFAPLKDVPKQMVYRLAEYCNHEREVIPKRVIERPPSAELAPGQKDTDSLPPYEILDQVLKRYVEEDQCVAEIVAAGFNEEMVRRITRMVDRNEYKRRQAPPGVKISRRAFGRDRRYPLTNGFWDSK